MDYRKKDRRADEGTPLDLERRSGPDRRQYQRILVDLEVDYRCEDTFPLRPTSPTSARLGIFVRPTTPSRPALTSTCASRFLATRSRSSWRARSSGSTPSDRATSTTSTPAMGVRFCDITLELKQHLVRLVRKIAYLEDDGSNPDAGHAEEGAGGRARRGREAAIASGGEPAGTDEEDESDDDIPLSVDVSTLKS